MYQDLEWQRCTFLVIYCQISDSTTSYGSLFRCSTEKKLHGVSSDIHTPKFIVESDATIVALLIFVWVLGCKYYHFYIQLNAKTL